MTNVSVKICWEIKKDKGWKKSIDFRKNGHKESLMGAGVRLERTEDWEEGKKTDSKYIERDSA